MIFIGLNILMWISLYCASTIDPGYLPRNIPEYDDAIRSVGGHVRFGQFQNPILACHVFSPYVDHCSSSIAISGGTLRRVEGRQEPSESSLSHVSNSKASAVEALSDMQPMRDDIRPSLSIHLQLCRLQQQVNRPTPHPCQHYS